MGIQPPEHLDYSHTTTYMQLCDDDICAMPEIAGVYERLGRAVPPCIVAGTVAFGCRSGTLWQIARVRRQQSMRVLVARRTSSMSCGATIIESRECLLRMYYCRASGIDIAESLKCLYE